MLYRQVETLIRSGFDAVIWQYEEASPFDWFSSDVPVICGTTQELDPTDVLVMPEGFVFEGVDPAPGCRKTIYNQNQYYTFSNVSFRNYPRWDPQPAVWVSSIMSRDILERLRLTLPISGVEYIPFAIDTELFRPQEFREKKVVWIPRKRPYEAELLHALFLADSRFEDVRFMPISGFTEERTAAEYGSASVFVSLGWQEGFVLPVAEALAAGSAVVGYLSGSGAEMFEAPGTYALPDSDVLAVVDQVADILADPPSDEERSGYRAWISERYTESTHVRCLTQAVVAARSGPATGGKATHPLAVMGAGSR